VKQTNLHKTTRTWRFADDHMAETDVHLVIEQELMVYINEEYLATLTSSPGSERELALGYLLSEAVLNLDSVISSLECCPGRINITVSHPLSPGPSEGIKPYRAPDNIAAASSNANWSRSNNTRYHAAHLLYLMHELDRKSHTFKLTGGVHTAALADNQSMLASYEDIGRHNAVDKVVGHAYLHQIPLADKCLILSGRITREIMAKAIRNKIPVVLSRSAPTLHAAEWAEQAGITLLGFARGQRFNVYSHPQRIIE